LAESAAVRWYSKAVEGYADEDPATRIWDLYAKAPSIDCRSRLDGSQVAF